MFEKCCFSILIKPECFVQTKGYLSPYWGPRKEKAAASQSLSWWVISAIHTAYRSVGILRPLGVRAHSSKTQGSMAAFYGRASLLEICRLVVWSSLDTSIKYYMLDLESSQATDVSKIALHSLFQLEFHLSSCEELRNCLTVGLDKKMDNEN